MSTPTANGRAAPQTDDNVVAFLVPVAGWLNGQRLDHPHLQLTGEGGVTAEPCGDELASGETQRVRFAPLPGLEGFYPPSSRSPPS